MICLTNPARRVTILASLPTLISQSRSGELLAKVTSCAVVGLDGALEVDISNGVPGFIVAKFADHRVVSCSTLFSFAALFEV